MISENENPPGLIQRVMGEAREARPLTWGELGMWLMFESIYPRNDSLNLSTVIDLSPKRSTEDVAVALAGLVARHEGLRTTFRVPEGSDQPVAVVGGEVTLEVSRRSIPSVSMPPREIDVYLGRVIREQSDRAFDISADLPIRACMVSVGDKVGWVVVTVSHMVSDGYSLRVLQEELLSLLGLQQASKGGNALVRPTQPRDISVWESSSSGRAQNSRALRRWRQALETSPPSMFPWGDELLVGDGRLGEATLVSRAVPLLTTELACRLNAAPSAVFLAALSVILSRLSGQPVALMQLVCNNRDSAAMAGVIGCVAQGGIFRVDTNTPTFSSLVKAVEAASIRTYSSARYNSLERNELVAEIARSRRSSLDLHTIVSDELLGSAHARREGSEDNRREIRKALTETSFQWRECDQIAAERFFLALYGDADQAVVKLKVDLRLFTQEVSNYVVRGIERILVDAHERDISPHLLTVGGGL